MLNSTNEFDMKLDAQEKTVRAEMEKLFALHQSRPEEPVENYTFQTPDGPVQLAELFGDKEELLLIHNMGRSCAYCTLWADGLIGLTPHIQDRVALALINNDSVAVQQTFATSRGWKFKTASAKDTNFAADMGFFDPARKMSQPGVSVFLKSSDGKITRKTRAGFGPGDLFCSLWSFFELLPGGAGDWEAQFEYGKNDGSEPRLNL